MSSVWPLYKTGSYLPESSPGAFPFSFCTSLALDRRMEARSLVKDPLLFNLPLVIYRGGVNAQHICLSVQKISKQTFSSADITFWRTYYKFIVKNLLLGLIQTSKCFWLVFGLKCYWRVNLKLRVIFSSCTCKAQYNIRKV